MQKKISFLLCKASTLSIKVHVTFLHSLGISNVYLEDDRVEIGFYCLGCDSVETKKLDYNDRNFER